MTETGTGARTGTGTGTGTGIGIGIGTGTGTGTGTVTGTGTEVPTLTFLDFTVFFSFDREFVHNDLLNHLKLTCYLRLMSLILFVFHSSS